MTPWEIVRRRDRARLDKSNLSSRGPLRVPGATGGQPQKVGTRKPPERRIPTSEPPRTVLWLVWAPHPRPFILFAAGMGVETRGPGLVS
jgi:hypothetical protein